VEVLSDALRLELAPFGIHVCVVEPGAIDTRFDDTAQRLPRAGSRAYRSPYRPLYETMESFAASMHSRHIAPEVGAEVVRRAVEAREPRGRYLAGTTPSGSAVFHARDLVWGRVSRRLFRFDTKEI